MTIKKLDLSHALAPLENELQDTLIELLALKKEDSPLFDAAIEDFIHKYGGLKYNSLEELLQSSAMEAQYTHGTAVMPLDDLIKDLTS